MLAGELKNKIVRKLRERRDAGISQTEIELLLGYSRSHVSETLNSLETDGRIVRKSEGRLIKRVWLKEFYPEYSPGLARVGILKSTEYLPFLECLFHVAESRSTELITRVYDDAMELVKDLQNGTLEAALAPTFTLVVSALHSGKIVIEGPIASGGSSIFMNAASSGNSCASSESSSMMLFTREYFSHNGVPEVEAFRNPNKAVKDFEGGKFKYITVWEPYRTIISDNGHEEISRYSEVLDQFPCCSVAYNRSFFSSEGALINEIHENYREITSHIDRIKPDSEAVSEISRITGVDREIAMRSLGTYKFQHTYDIDTVRKYLEKMGIIIPENKIRQIFIVDRVSVHRQQQ